MGGVLGNKLGYKSWPRTHQKWIHPHLVFPFAEWYFNEGSRITKLGRQKVLMLHPGFRWRVRWLHVQFTYLCSSAACFVPHFCNSITSIIVEELGTVWPLGIKFSGRLTFWILRKNLRLCIAEELGASLSLSCLSHSHQIQSLKAGGLWCWPLLPLLAMLVFSIIFINLWRLHIFLRSLLGARQRRGGDL